MNERNAPERAYLLGSVIVWAGIFLAMAVILTGTVRGADAFMQLLPVLTGGAVWFVIIVPGALFPRRASQRTTPARDRLVSHVAYHASHFGRFARWTAHAAGHPRTFIVALSIILLWALTGPFFGFSDTWQLVINTGTTIVTFLMVFLIQNTQNRDSMAVQLKLDELVRATAGAHNALLDLEELTESDLEQLRARYEQLACAARAALQQGQFDTDTPDVSR
jgi:low affinity Fe/Cu permease